MYIEDMKTVTGNNFNLIQVTYVGPSIDEEKILTAVSTEFGGDWEIVDLEVEFEEGHNRAFCKRLEGDNMNRNELKDLEDAQVALVNGATPTNEVLPPVARVAATDEQVDALVEEAEAELVSKPTTTVRAPVTASKKAKVTVEKKKKKIDIARAIFASNSKQERKTVIVKIMDKTGLGKVAAATYYQICKRES